MCGIADVCKTGYSICNVQVYSPEIPLESGYWRPSLKDSIRIPIFSSHFETLYFCCHSARRKRIISFPNTIPVKQSRTLRKAYPHPDKTFPSSKRRTVSKEKVEKVVKPPQIPIFRNRRARGGRGSQLSESSDTAAIRKEPKKLISRVIHGNETFWGEKAALKR